MCSWTDYFEMKNENENEARQAAAEFAELSLLSVKSGTTTIKNAVANVQLGKRKIEKSSPEPIHSIMQNCQNTEETSSAIQHSKVLVSAVDKVKNSRTEMRTNDLKDKLNNQEVSAKASKDLIHAISKKNLSLLKSADVSSQVPVIAITDPNHLLSKKSLKKTSEVTSENKLNENCDKEVGQINNNVKETKPLNYSPIVSNDINEITAAEETINDVCPNCKKLREEMNTVKKQAHSNFHIFKQKLMSTSELITEYHKKNQELDKQIKINSALKKKLDSCYGENGSLRIQLEKTVQANEPLKKTIQRLEYEKSVSQVEKGEIEKHLASLQTDADEAKELIFSSKMKQEALRKEKQDFVKQHEKEKKKVLNQAKLLDKLNEKLKQSRVQVKNLIAASKQFVKEKEKLANEIHKLQTKNRTLMQKPRPGKASRKSPSGVLSPSPSPPHYHHNTAIDNQAQENKTLLKNMVSKKESKSSSSSSGSSDSSCESESESDDDLKYRLNQILRSTVTPSTRLRLPTYLSPPLSPMPPSPLRVPNSNNNSKAEFNRNSPLVEEVEKIPDADVEIEDSDIAMNDEATLFGDISQSDDGDDFTPLADIPIEDTNSIDENVLRNSDKIEHTTEKSFKNVLGTPMETTISLNNSLTNNTEYEETLNNTESQETLNNTVYKETLNNTEYKGTMNNTESENTLNNAEAKEQENLEKQDNEKCTFSESEVVNKSLNSAKTDFVVSSVGYKNYNLSSAKQQTAIYNRTELVGKKNMQPHHSRSLSFSGTNSDSAFRPVTRSISNLCMKNFEKEFNGKNESIPSLSQDTSSEDFKAEKNSRDIEPEPPSVMHTVLKHEDKKIYSNTFKQESLLKSKTGEGNSIIFNCGDVSKTFDLNSETTVDLSCSIKDQDIDESETISSFTNDVANKPPTVSNGTESKLHDVITDNKSLPSIISLRKRNASISELNPPKTKMKLTPSSLPVNVNENESRVVDKKIPVHTNDDKENTEQKKETIFPDDTESEKSTDPKKNESSVESNTSDEIIVIKKKPLTTRVKKYTNKRRTIITKRKHFVSIAMPILLESISDDKAASKSSLSEERANDSEVASFDLATETSDKKEVHGNNINQDNATGNIYLSPITSEDSHKNSVVDGIPVATSLSIFTTIESHNCPKVTFTCAKTNPASVTRTTRSVLRRHSLFSSSSTSSVPAQRIDRSRSLSPSMFKPPSPPLSPIPPSPRRSMLTPIISPLPTTPLPESVSPLPPSPKITSPPLIRGSALLCSDNSTVFAPKPLAHKSLNAAKELSFSRTVANSIKNTDTTNIRNAMSSTTVNFSRGLVVSTATPRGNLEVHKPLVSNPMGQNAAEKIIERADVNFASKSTYEQHAACAKKLKTFLSNANKQQGHNTKRQCNSSTISKAPLSKVPKTITSSVSFKRSEFVETTSKLHEVSKLSSTYTTVSPAFTTTSVFMYNVTSPAVDTGVSSVTDVIMSQATNIRMLPKNPSATALARLPKNISLAVTSVSSFITPTLPAVDTTVLAGMDAFTSVVTSVSLPVATPKLPTRGTNVSAALDSCISPVVDTISLAVTSISSYVVTPTVVAVHTTVPVTMDDCTSDKKGPILTVIKPKSLPKDTTISVTMDTCTSSSLVTISSVVTSALTSVVTAMLPITCTSTSMDSCTLQPADTYVPRTFNTSLLPVIRATTCSSTTTCSSLLTTMPQGSVIGTTMSVVTRDSNVKHENKVSHSLLSGAVSKKQNPQPFLKGDSSRYVNSSEDDCLQIVTEDSSQDESSYKPQKATMPKKKQPILKSLSSTHKFSELLRRPAFEKAITAKSSAAETKEEEGEISNSDEEALRIAPEVDEQRKTIANMEISVVAAPGKVKRLPTNISKELTTNKKKRNPKETEVGFTLKLLQKYLNTSIHQDNLIAALRDRQNLSHVISLNKAYLLLLRTCEETLLPKILRCLETGDSICECEGNKCQFCSQLTCQCPRELPDFCTECKKRRAQHNGGELDLDAQLRKNIFRVCHPKAEKLCTPILTAAEHSLLIIFQEITREKHLENACNSLLNLLHETIFSNQEMLSCERMALCRFYAAMCRVYDRLDELVTFIYSLAYDSLPISYPMVFVTCYSVWPSFLARADIWSHNQDGSEKLTLYKVKLSPLSAVLQLVALGDAVTRKESTCQKILEKLLDIKWSSDACYYEDVASELFSLLCNSQLSFVTKLEDGSLLMCEFVFPVIKAMQVLCKRLGWEWCYNVLIVQKSWNVLRAWSEGGSSVCDDTVAIVIRLIGHLCRGGFACGYRDFTELASTLSSFLQKISDCETVAESVHIATAYTLLDIAPSDPEKCSFVLRTWLDQCEKAYTIPQSLRQNIAYLAPR